MAANVKQKIAIVPNDANLLNLLQQYLALGFVIHSMINLAPGSNNIMIGYYDPAIDA